MIVTMPRLLTVGALALATTVAFAQPGFAQGKGQGGGNAGGSSGSHMSTQGGANTNGPNATDRDKGLDRAGDRMNTQGAEHNRATSKLPKGGAQKTQ